MKLKLNSDFHELYDFGFDNEGLEFRRITTDGPTRKEMFKGFKRLGLVTPFFGSYQDFVDAEFSQEQPVVVHFADLHCGEGKELHKLKDVTDSSLLVQYIDYPITAFRNFKSKSYRLLFIGNRCFQYEYLSWDDWRSNCGDGDIINLSEILPVPQWRSSVYYSLFSIDFVGELPNLYAVDFNVAPGIWKDIYKLIQPSQIVSQIKSWYKEWAT